MPNSLQVPMRLSALSMLHVNISDASSGEQLSNLFKNTVAGTVTLHVGIVNAAPAVLPVAHAPALPGAEARACGKSAGYWELRFAGLSLGGGPSKIKRRNE